MGLVRTLIDRDQEYAEPTLPQGLRELYDGDLHFPTPPARRPFVIGNFVSTLDGSSVTSLKIMLPAQPSVVPTPRTVSSWASCGLLLMPS